MGVLGCHPAFSEWKAQCTGPIPACLGLSFRIPESGNLLHPPALKANLAKLSLREECVSYAKTMAEKLILLSFSLGGSSGVS